MVVVPGKKLVMPKYCESTHQTKRRPTRTVEVCAHAQPC